MKLKKHHYFFFFVGFLFLGITSVKLFSDGMFMDGLWYADISRNMAKGLGSFWKPHLSYGIFNEFYEHPPLALGLQSLFFRFFGDSIYIERFYSLFTYITTGYLIVLIWGKLTNNKRNAWIPLFLWITITGIAWAAANNMLENTMSIFVCLSVLFYFNSSRKNHFIWIFFSGISLSLGLLTKGFFCLYIWGIPFFMWLFKRKQSFIQMSIDTFVLIFSTILPIVLLYCFVPAAQNNMICYFKKQVVGSIQNVQTVNTRFEIIIIFAKRVIPPLIISTIAILIALKHKVEKRLLKINQKEALIFMAIVFSGIIPIMISMKQRSFYILTVYPLFALGLAYYIYPMLNIIIEKINPNTKGFKIFKIITILIVISSIMLSISQKNRIGRDKTLITDSKAIISTVGENTTINICPSMYGIWSLHGYFSRYGNVSLDRNQDNICLYYLSFEGCNNEYLDKNYALVPIKTKKYKLYKRRNNTANL